MKQLLLTLLIFSSALLWCIDTESIVISNIQQFADEFVNEIEQKNLHTTLAISEFVDKDKVPSENNIGFVVSDIMRSRFSKSEKVNVIEQEQVDTLLDNMKAGLSGFYDDKTVASIGYLVGAEYMLLGSVSQIAGFYRITARLVEIESGLYILTKEMEIDSALLDKESQKYQPPKYRVRVGAVYSNYPQEGNWYDDNMNRYNLGVTTGLYYPISNDQTISVLFDYFFYNMNYRISKDNSNSYYALTIYLRQIMDLSTGYGYEFPVTKFFDITLNGHIGYQVLSYFCDGGRMEDLGDPSTSEVYDNNNNLLFHHSFFITPSVDFTLNTESNLSLFINMGYKFNFSSIDFIWPHINPEIDVNETLHFNGFTSRMGIQFYF